MASLTTLTLSDFTRSFDVTTDASTIAVGSVLSQGTHPIAFFIKRLWPCMQAASAYVWELFAIMEVVKKWHQCLIGRKFHTYIDQQSLKDLLSRVVQTPEQYKWETKLFGYDFEILYKPERENIVANALSRINQPQLLTLSTTDPSWLIELRTFYTTNQGKSLVQKLLHKADGPTSFQVHDGLLYYHHCLYIPEGTTIRQQLLHEYPCTPLRGHSSILPTIKRISSTFVWPKLKPNVTLFIRNCTTYQQIKTPTHKPYGLLQPLPIPSTAW